MTASWSPRTEHTVGPWFQPAPPQDLPPLRLTPLGRIALRIAVTAVVVLAAALGFLIRTPLDRAVERCAATNTCHQLLEPTDPAHNARSERTP